MKNLTIKELEDFSGIKAHTIRIWEKRYRFLSPQRSASNYRYYSVDETKKLLDIALLNKNGYKISRLARMADHELKNMAVELTATEARQHKAIHQLIGCWCEGDIEHFEIVLDGCVIIWGIEQTLTEVIMPFCERVGLLEKELATANGTIRLFVSSLRQKMMLALETINPSVQTNKTALLFLSQSRYSELLLLYAACRVKGAGVRFLYLGAEVPWKEAVAVARSKQPHFLITCGGEKRSAPLWEEHVRPNTTQVIILSENPVNETSATAMVKCMHYTLTGFADLLDEH